MLFKRLHENIDFGVRALNVLLQYKVRFFSIVILSAMLALSEGFGVMLLVPVLESINSDSEMFLNLPLLGEVSKLFGQVAPAERLRLAAIFMFAIIIVRGVLLYLSQFLSLQLGFTVKRDLSTQTYQSLLYSNFGYISGSSAGQLATNVRELPMRVSALLTNLMGIFINALIVLTYLVLMTSLSWEMTLLALSFLALVSESIKHLLHRALRVIGVQVTKNTEVLLQRLYETINGIKLVQVCSNEKLMLDKYATVLNDEAKYLAKQARIRELIGPFMATSSGVLICALVLMASYGENVASSAGAIVLFMFLLFRLLSPITTINTARASVQSDMHALEQMDDFIVTTEAQRQPDGEIPFNGLKESIVFDGVEFTYPSGEGRALSNLNLEIPRGNMVAIVGPSGAGKSTIVSLLARFFDPDKGTIRVDGTDLKDLQLATWRKSLAAVSQDFYLFNDTVANNIAFGCEGASLDDIRAAAQLADMDEFVMQLPDGYETILGERGTRLSGGQQQRIAMARAILSNPDILVLDEATSQLDSITEHAIQSAVDQLRKNRTVIVIAHRLSTICRANQIVVLDLGRAVEQGTHEQLLEQKGHYWQLIQHQKLDIIDEETVAS